MHVIPNQSIAVTLGEEKLFMSSMSLQCPSCGRQDLELKEQCTCGINADESFTEELEKKSIDTVKSTSLRNVNEPKNNNDTKKVVIKEIDSWIFIFSPVDNCIYLATPALQSFRLKLTLHDLEELLEFMYHKTGQEKTNEKTQTFSHRDQ
jgi:hypothetical protein